MIDTGGSVERLVRELNARNVAKVHIVAIHPVLSDPAPARLLNLYEEGLLHSLIVTDTLKCNPEVCGNLPFVHVVPSARLSAEIVLRMHREESLSPFFDRFDPRAYMARRKLAT
jgi:ribose-phosphate pyrophosphokinase